MALPIEDYALLGDRHTAALVGRNGSVDWLCLPRFDSPACFAALLGTEDHGRWLLSPVGDHEVSRRYVEDSTVLETTFTTPTGSVTLLDLMPTCDGRADLVRRVTGVSGTVRIRHEWIVRMDYGEVHPWVRRRTIHGEKVIVAIAGPDQLILRGPRLPRPADHRHADEFDVHEGEVLTFATTWLPSYADVPAPAGPGQRHRRHHRRGPRVGRAGPLGRPPRRDGAAEPAHPAVADARADRWHRRRPHHVAAGGLRWRAQLGLPLLLAPRRGTDPRGAGQRRLHRGARGCGGTGSCVRWPATPRTCRSCTPWTAPAGCPSTPSTTCPAMRARRRCGSATARSASDSPTCSAR